MRAIISDRHRALQRLVGTLDIAAAAGSKHWSTNYFERQRPIAEMARSGELSEGISEVLENRVVRNGLKAKGGRAFSEKVLSLGQESSLAENRDFMRYLRGLSAAFSNSGGLRLGSGSDLALALFGQSVAEYEMMQKIDTARIVLRFHSWKYGPFKLSDMAERARELFGRNGKKGVAKTAVLMVAKRMYGSLEEASKSYDAIFAEAEAKFGFDKESEGIVPTAAHLVFIKAYKGVDAAKEAYDRILEEARIEFNGDEKLAKYAAFLVWKKTYRTVAEARTSHAKILTAAEKVFGADEQTQGVIRTAAFLVWKKAYKSVAKAKEAYDTILKEATNEFSSDEGTAGIAPTAASRIFSGVYKNAKDAKKIYDAIFSESERVFGADFETEDLVKGAACLVFIRTYESVTKAKETYDAISAETKIALGTDKEAKKRARAFAYLVWTKKYESVDEVIARHSKCMVDARTAFSDDENAEKIIKTAALLLLNRTYKTGTEVKRARDEAMREATLFFGAESQTKKLLRTVAHLAWCKVYPNVGSIRDAYCQILEKVGDLLIYHDQHMAYSATVASRLLTEKAHRWEEKDIRARVQELRLAFSLYHDIATEFQDYHQPGEVETEFLPGTRVSLASRSAVKSGHHWQPPDVFEEFERWSKRRLLHRAIAKLGIAQRYTVQQFFEGERSSLPDDVFNELKAAMEAVIGGEGDG